MRVPRLISEFIEWRWAPCVCLILGSLAFVALSLLMIPAQIESSPELAEALRANRVSPTVQPRALFGASLVQRNVRLAQPGSESGTALASDVTPSLGDPIVEATPPPPGEPGRSYPQQAEPIGPARGVTAP